MVIILNKSNRPIGVAGQSVLPDREIQVRDVDVYCAVYDEYGRDTGKKALLPGLRALEGKGFVVIKTVEEKAEEPVAEAEPVEEEKPKKKTTSRSRKKAKPEVEPEEEITAE